jgi:hypothetical protein
MPWNPKYPWQIQDNQGDFSVIYWYLDEGMKSGYGFSLAIREGKYA